MHLPRSLPLALVLAATVNGFNCPKSDIKATKCLGPKDCLYANPRSCSNFIQCTINDDGVTGTPVVMPCPAGLEWNNKQKYVTDQQIRPVAMKSKSSRMRQKKLSQSYIQCIDGVAYTIEMQEWRVQRCH